MRNSWALEVIIDWTSVGVYNVLSALIGVRGRAVPVLQWAVPKGGLKKSQDKLEEEFLLSLRPASPAAPSAWKRRTPFRTTWRLVCHKRAVWAMEPVC